IFDSPTSERSRRKERVKLLAKGSRERTMHRRPVRGGCDENAFQAKQGCGSAETDEERVAIEVRGHATPIRQALLTEGSRSIKPRHSEQQRDPAVNQRSSKHHGDCHSSVGELQGVRGVVQVHQVSDTIAKRENHQIAANSPKRPESNTLPRNRVRRFRLQTLQEYEQRRDAQPAEKEPGNSKIDESTERR